MCRDRGQRVGDSLRGCISYGLHSAWSDRFSAEDVLCDICGDGDLYPACGDRVGSACKGRPDPEEESDFVGVEMCCIQLYVSSRNISFPVIADREEDDRDVVLDSGGSGAGRYFYF